MQNKIEQTADNTNGNIIYSYSKKDAVEDGSQVLLSELHKKIVTEAGFVAPLYLTDTVYQLLQVPAGLEGLQDFDGRCWDLLTMAKLEIKRMQKENDYFGTFQVIFLNQEQKQITEKLYIVFNEAEGFTIMFPEEY